MDDARIVKRVVEEYELSCRSFRRETRSRVTSICPRAKIRLLESTRKRNECAKVKQAQKSAGKGRKETQNYYR